ncbi:MAG: 3-isopropylmalate dehydratase, partial [Paracoccaceae bacterium]
VGSSREQAAEVLKFLGVSCIIAKSFAGIFYRNAINLGLPVFTLPSEPSLPKQFVDGSFVNFDFDSTTLKLEQTSLQVKLDPLPKFLRELIIDGGLVSHLEKRFSEK